MERRQFLTASVAASAMAVSGRGAAQANTAAPAREYYMIRRYAMVNGPQTKLTEGYFSEALIPALGRIGMGAVGAFRLEFGPETPAFYLLVPSSNLQALVELNLRLTDDAAFVQAAAPFWNATAAAPAFVRAESWLLSAFAGWPKLTPPPGAGTKAKRILQLRTYESPSNGDHVRKVEMFHAGEFDIFLKSGFHPVFFGDTLVGSRMPSLTYMVSFSGQAELEACWDKFRDNPDWKKLSGDPRYSADQIVTSISNLILSPLSCSQV